MTGVNRSAGADDVELGGHVLRYVRIKRAVAGAAGGISWS